MVHTVPMDHRLIGQVARRSPREWKVPSSNPACIGIFLGSSHTSNLKIGSPVATLPGAWCYRVSTGTGQPSVSILWLGEVERLICNIYLSVAARKIVRADRSLKYTIACCWDVKKQTNKQTNPWTFAILSSDQYNLFVSIVFSRTEMLHTIWSLRY